MSAQFLEGRPVADAVLADVSERVKKLKHNGIVPGLGTILVGDSAGSAGYIQKKHETCKQVGFGSFDEHIPVNATQADLLGVVREFNERPEVHGFLIQFPVPEGFDYGEAVRSHYCPVERFEESCKVTYLR